MLNRRRQRRRPGLGLRSVVVAWLRVVLPLAALALLSTLFMWQKRPDLESAIPYADVGPSALSGPPRITMPQWVGVTRDGAQLKLSATMATSHDNGMGEGGGRAARIRLDWLGVNGVEAVAMAPQAVMSGDAITLSGGAILRLSSGWSMVAAELIASPDHSDVSAEGGVQITAPFGQLTADTGRLHRPENGNHDKGNEVLDFTGDVRLLYEP